MTPSFWNRVLLALLGLSTPIAVTSTTMLWKTRHDSFQLVADAKKLNAQANAINAQTKSLKRQQSTVLKELTLLNTIAQKLTQSSRSVNHEFKVQRRQAEAIERFETDLVAISQADAKALRVRYRPGKTARRRLAESLAERLFAFRSFNKRMRESLN